ncbi:DUF5008 domain-containing protein [Arachidicoccus soli]|uniref:DUF5008 domain-containing protein n=1 Tax=Arachidicoccus soli TaxID=2341117 RepID=A0A386HRU1_9BACT|nr:DUF5008 domain-containing protein [Arachidicoccus soli]AYD48513.1 DUF5008 domain-containing protein [Arachidicoccus soli]
MYKRYFYRNAGILLTLLVLVAGVSCKKTDSLVGSPYGAPVKQPVQFLDAKPSETSGLPGDEVTFKVMGLKEQTDFQVFFNQILVQPLSYTDSLLTIVIPQNASSGTVSVTLKDGRNFFGPLFTVIGYVSLDPTFSTGSGINGTVYGFARTGSTAPYSYLIYGSFNNYNNTATATKFVNNVEYINSTGGVANNSQGLGASGAVYAGLTFQTSESQFIIGGAFSKYANRSNINNITRIHNDLSLDTLFLQVPQFVNPDPVNNPKANYDTVAKFNGGFNTLNRGGNPVVKLFKSNDGKVIVVGNFNNYDSIYYPRSTASLKVQDLTTMVNVAKIDTAGSLDLTYNFNTSTHTSGVGANGYILSAIKLDNDHIVMVGDFSSYNGQSVGRIVAVDQNGQPDYSFNTGTGANDAIKNITFCSATQKILITGLFTSYNGVACNGVVMLNTDGTVDNSFSQKIITGGIVNYAGQLNNGKIIISGNFKTYDNVVRQGFVIANPDGSLASGYNNIGAFGGQIYAIDDLGTNFGVNAVMLFGSISVFDSQQVGGIVKILLQSPH